MYPGSVQVTHMKVQSVQAGGNVTFSCQLATNEDVIQVTWQKEMDGDEGNIATYSTINGQKIAKDYDSHVSFADSGLQTSAISLHKVTLQDEGCYKCIFNTFPSGAITGRTCLKVYAISDPKVEAKFIPSPDISEDSEKVVGMSCSATGKPAPKISWSLPSILLQKPREYHVRLGNQTVTVISNFTHTLSKILQEYPIACVIQHPSLNVTLALPMDSLAQGQYTALLLLWSRKHGNISWGRSEAPPRAGVRWGRPLKSSWEWGGDRQMMQHLVPIRGTVVCAKHRWYCLYVSLHVLMVPHQFLLSLGIS
ncbi:OX-2 membrane glycoprotein-like isoform X4 [Anser cygnoides]|uniref:OX-2 membrane glycoprotein-like isoform X4 n=1 Tax=Anser cygnoides TaxID=8845 RepID=UPI0034D1971C